MRRPDPRRLPPGVHRKRAKGHTYYYFDTGAKNERSQPVLARLPDLHTIEFGPAYAAALASKSRRAAVADTLTLRSLGSLWQKGPEYGKLAKGTRQIYTRYADVLIDQLGTAPADAVEGRDIRLLLDRMAEKPGAANMVLAVTGAIYAWGRKRGHVTADPVAGIERFGLGEHDPWPEYLIQEALSDKDPLIRAGVALLYFTALRIGDVCQLRWSDLRDGRVRVRQQKTGGDLDFPQHAELPDHLPPPTGLTVLAHAGGAYSPVTLRKRLQNWAAERGHKIVPHGLRKSAVNALLEAGCSVAETAAISGQSLAMIEHYAKRRDRAVLGSAAILKWQTNKARR